MYKNGREKEQEISSNGKQHRNIDALGWSRMIVKDCHYALTQSWSVKHSSLLILPVHMCVCESLIKKANATLVLIDTPKLMD